MGAISKIWDDYHVDIYSKYMLFRAIPCNLLLWGCEIWDLRKSLLASLEVLLHRGIRMILKIRMVHIIDQHIKNSSIREIFYNISMVQNQIAFFQITYLSKLFRRKASHIPTRILTVWCNHPCKVGRLLLTNNKSMVSNIRHVILGVYGSGALSAWGVHALDTQH